jgi:predicted RNA binding protein YcfA (HicA-like mRNA interferase family)
MTKYTKLLAKVLSGRSDASIDFDDLRRLLDCLGFAERIRGSHHVFVKDGVRDMINLQKEGRMAKTYQVRQVRTVITAYGLAIDEEE